MKGVECSTIRQAVSAELDGEDPGVPGAAVAAHLAGCAACTAWRERAADLSRRTRVSGVDPLPDLSQAVLAKVTLPKPRRRIDLRWQRWLPVALAVVAIGQLAVGLAQLFSPIVGHGAHSAGEPLPVFGHVERETAAFNLAIGVGLLWVALHPERALGQVPLLVSLVLALSLVTAFDLGRGDVGLVRLSTHLPVLLAALIVLAMTRGRTTPADPGSAHAGDHERAGAIPDEPIRTRPDVPHPHPPAAEEHRRIA